MTTVFQRKLDLLVVERALLHDPRGAQLVAAVHDRHLGREPGEEERLFERGVAAADDRDLLAAEEEPVAGGARRDSRGPSSRASPGTDERERRARPDARMTASAMSVGSSSVAEPEENGVAERSSAASPWRRAGPRRSAAPGPRIRPMRSGPRIAVDEAGVVLDLGREHQLATGLVRGGRGLALEHDGGRAGRGRCRSRR